MIAAVAAARERVGLRQPLEVDARHVVEQQVVVEGEQLPEPRHEMLFKRRLVRHEPIQGAIQPIVIDQRRGQGEQVLKRRAAVPRLGDVQLARGLAQPGEHEHRRHRGPRHRFPALRQQAPQRLVESQGAPERPAEPHLAKRAAALQPDVLEPDRDRFVGIIGDEQVGLFALAGNRAGQGLGACAALGIEFPEMGDRLLDDLATDADRADELPVPVDLPVLPARRVTQVHYPAYRA